MMLRNPEKACARRAASFGAASAAGGNFVESGIASSSGPKWPFLIGHFLDYSHIGEIGQR
jgi:hypothetical protein